LIAAQLYTVRDQIKDPARMGGVLGRLREIGYHAVEVAGLGPNTTERFGQELARADLTACAAHAPLERLTGDLAAVAAECREWGCKYVVIPSLPNEYRSGAGRKRFVRVVDDIARDLQPFGLKLAYHNHSFELERWEGQTWLEALFGATPAQTLQAELDTYWLQYGGADPAQWILRLKNRVPIVHLKDMAVVEGKTVMAEVGEGNLDWARILDACRTSGTEWLVVEQDECRRDPMESLAISFANLTKLTASQGRIGPIPPIPDGGAQRSTGAD
jgi:sugar phosphate isomerase/epimerase